ncbi:hypothetical protein K457DRAFT_16167 [Linnemannia elongata AG-77]|uniref:Uncharacterized protein n=1 Tax=Linnemannia elongata AG-77 TaxID=1314771 RepID=A0A197K607_9FUNG|nr:hypothetical protein K457DRAFT_16167 [Linnemannia elongata AG-77]
MQLDIAETLCLPTAILRAPRKKEFKLPIWIWVRELPKLVYLTLNAERTHNDDNDLGDDGEDGGQFDERVQRNRAQEKTTISTFTSRMSRTLSVFGPRIFLGDGDGDGKRAWSIITTATFDNIPKTIPSIKELEMMGSQGVHSQDMDSFDTESDSTQDGIYFFSCYHRPLSGAGGSEGTAMEGLIAEAGLEVAPESPRACSAVCV